MSSCRNDALDGHRGGGEQLDHDAVAEDLVYVRSIWVGFLSGQSGVRLVSLRPHTLYHQLVCGDLLGLMGVGFPHHALGSHDLVFLIKLLLIKLLQTNLTQDKHGARLNFKMAKCWVMKLPCLLCTGHRRLKMAGYIHNVFVWVERGGQEILSL